MNAKVGATGLASCQIPPGVTMWACAATDDVSSDVPLAVFAGSFAYLTISKRTAEELFLLLGWGSPVLALRYP